MHPALHPAFHLVSQRLREEGRSKRQEERRALTQSWSGFEDFEQPTSRPYSRAIYRVLKQVHRNTEISAEAATVVHDLIVSSMARVVSEAAGLVSSFTETKREYRGDTAEMIIGNTMRWNTQHACGAKFSMCLATGHRMYPAESFPAELFPAELFPAEL